MTQAKARLSWGEREKVNSTVTGFEGEATVGLRCRVLLVLRNPALGLVSNIEVTLNRIALASSAKHGTDTR
jgi:hypothetical protein